MQWGASNVTINPLYDNPTYSPKGAISIATWGKYPIASVPQPPEYGYYSA